MITSDAMDRQFERPRGIPSLDGLRALSVVMVVLGHTRSQFLDHIPGLSVFRNGEQGVEVFFVISGFLITHLLLREWQTSGTIDLKRFYLRRTFRIFPPFYAFLAVIACLGALHWVYVTRYDLLLASTYTWNTIPHSGGWVLGHCWSLALEEQFYLLWPFCFRLFTPKQSLRIALVIVLVSPILRICNYFFFPPLRGYVGMMLPTRADTVMTGCILALLVHTQEWKNTKVGAFCTRLALSPWSSLAAVLFLALADGPLERRFRGFYSLPFGISLENIAIAIILVYVVFRHESLPGKLLNVKAISHFGVISYSIYLWQQLFTGEYTRQFPLNIAFIVLCAELSYWLVEKPSFRLRAVAERKWLSPKARLTGPRGLHAKAP